MFNSASLCNQRHLVLSQEEIPLAKHTKGKFRTMHLWSWSYISQSLPNYPAISDPKYDAQPCFPEAADRLQAHGSLVYSFDRVSCAGCHVSLPSLCLLLSLPQSASSCLSPSRLRPSPHHRRRGSGRHTENRHDPHGRRYGRRCGRRRRGVDWDDARRCRSRRRVDRDYCRC
jgi:hypothetical protein